jgi:SOS-response transcriptional repressor LexA
MSVKKKRTKRPLTVRQQEVLNLVVHGEQRGMQPTIREMCTALGISSTNAVSDHIRALQRKGMVIRNGKSRHIEVTPSGYYAAGVKPHVKVPLSLWKRMIYLMEHPSLANWNELAELVATHDASRSKEPVFGASPHATHPVQD